MGKRRYNPDPYPEADREPPVLSGRVPPHDLAAEAACLSAALLDDAAADVILAELEPDHFYSDNHRLIFSAVKGLRDDRIPIDLVNVASWLRNREIIQRAGGAKYIGELVDSTPAIANVAAHAETVREKWQARHLISTAQKIAGEGYGSIPVHREWVASCEKRLFDATRGHEKRHPELIGKYVAAGFDAMMDPAVVDQVRVLTDFEDYDEEIGGWFCGSLICYAARPGIGKSALVQRKVRNICAQRWAPGENEDEGPLRYECLLFSPEMPKHQVSQRFLAQESKVNLSKIVKGGPFTAVEVRELKAASQRLQSLHIHVDDTPNISALEVVSKTRRFVASVRDRGRQVGGVVVDYLQKCSWPGDVEKRSDRVGNMTNAFKNLAMELTIPMVALSQLNRGVESRPMKDRRPWLNDLRDSGEIEQDCDAIVFIYRESYYSKSADQKEAELIVAKNRNGPTGIIKVGWWSWCTRFTNLSDA